MEASSDVYIEYWWFKSRGSQSTYISHIRVSIIQLTDVAGYMIGQSKERFEIPTSPVHYGKSAKHYRLIWRGHLFQRPQKALNCRQIVVKAVQCMLHTAQLGGHIMKASRRSRILLFSKVISPPSTQTSTQQRAHGEPIKPTGQALTLINPFHKRHYHIILTLQ